jgi:hypothetical protein
MPGPVIFPDPDPDTVISNDWDTAGVAPSAIRSAIVTNILAFIAPFLFDSGALKRPE